MEFTTEFLIFASIIIFLSALVQATIGFGFPMIATPLLAMVTDIKTAVIYVAIPTLVLNLSVLIIEGNFFTNHKKVLSFSSYGYDWKCHRNTNLDL